MSCRWGIRENSVAHLFLVSLKALDSDCFCLLVFPLITPLSYFFSIFFWGFFSPFFFLGAGNVAFWSIQHTVFPIPYPLLITSSTSSKTALLSFPWWDLPFLFQHGPLPGLLTAHVLSASIIPRVPYRPLTQWQWLAVPSCLSPLLQLLILPVGPALIALSIWAMPTHLTAFIFLSAKDLASFLAELCHKMSTLLPPWWGQSSCKTNLLAFVLQVVAKKCVIKSFQCHLWEHLKNNFVT